MDMWHPIGDRADSQLEVKERETTRVSDLNETLELILEKLEVFLKRKVTMSPTVTIG
jgi:hypothetical protein